MCQTVRELLPPKIPASAFKRPRVVDFESIVTRLWPYVANRNTHCEVHERLVQCLHMAIMHTTEWNPPRFVSRQGFEPQCLAEIFQLFGYTTLHKRMAITGPFGALYRKAFPAKRQPRHWDNAVKQAWKIRAVRVHLTELATWYFAGLLPFRPPGDSLETHRQWAPVYFNRMIDTGTHALDFCQAHLKESITVVACFFERLMHPFRRQWQVLSPVWNDEYVAQLYSIKDIGVFNSLMASMGPQCLVPLNFWETVFQHLGAEPFSHPEARDPDVDIHLVADGDQESAHRFLAKFGTAEAQRQVGPIIGMFYRDRLGPSVLKSILLKKIPVQVQQVVKQLAWLWFTVFGSHRVPWPSNLDREARRAIEQRWKALQITDLATLGRRLQLCLNCGLVHTVHNQPASFKPGVATTVYDAAKTIGVVGASYDVLRNKSYCGRQNSQISLGCKKAEAVCFNVQGWVYHNFTCYFICTACGIPAVWDSSSCKFVQTGPMCSLCSVCRPLNM